MSHIHDSPKPYSFPLPRLQTFDFPLLSHSPSAFSCITLIAQCRPEKKKKFKHILLTNINLLNFRPAFSQWKVCSLRNIDHKMLKSDLSLPGWHKHSPSIFPSVVTRTLFVTSPKSKQLENHIIPVLLHKLLLVYKSMI